ncbi:MAG TPA: asparagine synthase (glutamine-hydrolyzing) [Acidimicrobiales bacterium]|nr:asparagine synthase (glutamine-hydrolyzing) [Acidimicrobiales bacterium]
MCGVTGIFDPRGDALPTDELERMTDRIAHRGPDDRGTFVAPGLALGHVRLSILDLSACAAQPMRSHDGRHVVSFNGEIFNFRDLRRGLEDAGVGFTSTGDTEVLVEHIARHGVAATALALEGDWAFAVWDVRERRLTLARDRHGVKPMYWLVDAAGRVRFASELKAFGGDVGPPDHTTVSAALLGLSGTFGDRTIFSRARAVEAGETVTFAGGVEPVRRRYFSLFDFADRDLYEELDRGGPERVVDRVQAAFESSTVMRMISDAPVACLASGGVDSNLVARVAAAQGDDLGLYHADVLGNSERLAAERLARTVGLPLHVETVSDEDILAAVVAVTRANDMPLIYHLNSIPFYLVSRLARRDGIKVLLTGEGSDEYFIGYPQYALAPVLRRVDGAKRAAQRLVHRATGRAGKLLWPRTDDRFPELLEQLLFRYEQDVVRRRAEEAFAFVPERQRRLHVMTMELVHGHLSSLLHRNDRLGMAWSLESRFPFLGHELARVAVNVPGRYKLRTTRSVHDRRHPFVVDKWPVREVARRLLPADLAMREKQGFPVTIYDRIRIDPECLAGGFVADFFGLGGDALETLAAEATPLWMTRLMLLETWGRLFAAHDDVARTEEWLAKHVRVS